MSTVAEPIERLAPAGGNDAFQTPITRNYVVIASIWPRPLIREEAHYQPQMVDGRIQFVPNTTYRIEAGAKSMTDAADNVRLLKVYDTYMVREIPETKRPEKLPLDARDVANGLVAVLTGVQGGARSRRAPGVMVLDGETPTQAEIQQLIVSQSTYLQKVCVKAEENARSGQMQLIGDAERMAAHWLNQQTRYDWVPMGEMGSTKTCFSCEGSIPKGALTCPTPGCGDLVRKALDYYSLREIKEFNDPVLYERVKLFQQREKDRERKAAERAAGKVVADDDEE